MKEGYKKKIKSRIEKYCDLHYTLINKDQMKLGKGIFNHRCQLNAVQQLKEGNATEVYSCICYSDKRFPVVHFINKDSEGFYVDNTLGWEYEQCTYYIINKIEESQFNRINDILMDLKTSLINACSNGFLVKLYRINNENLGI